MPCIKTGFHGFLHQYGEYVYGDAFVVEGAEVAYFRINQRSFTPLAKKLHFTILDYDNWWDKHNSPSTLITCRGSYIYHGYKGIPTPTL